MDDIRTVNLENAGGAMRIVGADRDLPALPGARIDAHGLQRDRQKTRCHLLAGCNDRVIFARIVKGGGVGAGHLCSILHPVHQLVGFTGHGGNDHGHFMAGIHFAFHMPCDIVNAFEVRDGRAAEFHDNASHSLDQYHPIFPPAPSGNGRTRTNPVGPS
ncbi:hypothetical protein D3C78_1143810 [compost metagenome]